MSVKQTIELLRNNYLKEHGVVNVRRVIAELYKAQANPVLELESLLITPEASQWHFYALEGLRSLAMHGRLARSDAEKLLEATQVLAQQFGGEEWDKSIRALTASKSTAPVLVDFVRVKLEKQDFLDWRWVAFSAVGVLLQKKTAEIPVDLAAQLSAEASNEPDKERATQLTEIASKLWGGGSAQVRSK